MIPREQNVCLNIGEKAPDFTLPDQNGSQVRLSDFKGKKNVVLVLHPSTLTKSCKDDIRFYQERTDEFHALNTEILVVNMDSIDYNRDWVKEIGGLSFPVLSDRDPLGGVSLTYDCFVPKEGYGNRAVFVIDKSGIIRHIEKIKALRGACPDMIRLSDVLLSLKS
ncbi:MAG: peroxiredoxin [Candidatus Thorarchaeota archaeon]|nr:MAG: peroxiredoxin [Candidatus Thorarchaeota archaeon]